MIIGCICKRSKHEKYIRPLNGQVAKRKERYRDN